MPAKLDTSFEDTFIAESFDQRCSIFLVNTNKIKGQNEEQIKTTLNIFTLLIEKNINIVKTRDFHENQRYSNKITQHNINHHETATLLLVN